MREAPPRTAAAREETALTAARMRAASERRPQRVWSNRRGGIDGEGAMPGWAASVAREEVAPVRPLEACGDGVAGVEERGPDVEVRGDDGRVPRPA
jgi:hypothetical protein